MYLRTFLLKYQTLEGIWVYCVILLAHRPKASRGCKMCGPVYSQLPDYTNIYTYYTVQNSEYLVFFLDFCKHFWQIAIESFKDIFLYTFGYLNDFQWARTPNPRGLFCGSRSSYFRRSRKSIWAGLLKNQRLKHLLAFCWRKHKYSLSLNILYRVIYFS